jgi:hypothetical protein
MLLRDFAHDRETIDWLLDQGVDISQTDTRRLDDGFNLAFEASDNSLHLLNKVAADGDIDLFDYLVSRGADASRSLALHTASKFQDPEKSRVMVCNLLDRHNMDISVNDRTFATRSTACSIKGRHCAAPSFIAILLLSRNCSTEARAPVNPDFGLSAML